MYLFVATLGYSRRVYVARLPPRAAVGWLEGIEGAFRHFGGVPGEVLLDNARALVEHHDAGTREVEFNERLHAFARYWGVRPVACAPYRARTKGKDERGVGYVKHNAIAGRSFAELGGAGGASGLVDARGGRHAGARHDGRGADRAVRARGGGGAAAAGRPSAVPAAARADPAGAERRLRGRGHQPLQRAVAADRRGGHVQVGGGQVRIHHAGEEVACHDERLGRRERAVDRAHLHGIVPRRPDAAGEPPAAATATSAGIELLRPLAEYEQVAGGGW